MEKKQQHKKYFLVHLRWVLQVATGTEKKV
jgi:hypothetical protein